MVIIDSTPNEPDRKFTKRFPKALNKYYNSDFAIQQKVRFVYYLSIVIIGLLLLAITITGYNHITNYSYGTLYFPVLIPEFICFFLVLASLFYLTRGHYNISSHLLLTSVFTTVWIVMLMDRADIITRLDTVALIIGLLSMLPLLITRKIYIVIYTLINISLLFIFMFLFKYKLDINDSSFIDYIVDSTIAMLFVGIVGYSIFNINNKALEKTVSEMKEHHEIEKALFRSEKKYDEMTDLLPQTIFEADMNGKFTYVNKKGLALFGYTLDDLQKGFTIMSILEESERARAAEKISNFIKGEKTEGSQFIALRKNGTTFPIQIYANIIEENNIKTGIRGIVIDITERTEAEQELKQSEERFRQLFDQAPVCMAISNSKGEIIQVNQKFSQTLGFILEDIPNIETWWLKAYPDETYRKEVVSIWTGAMSNAIENNTNIPAIEYSITDKFGTIHSMLIGASIQKDSLHISLVDISDRKKAEDIIKTNELRLQKAQMVGRFGYSEQYLNNSQVWASAEALKMYGFKPEEGFLNPGQIIACIVDIEPFRIAYRELLEKGKRFDMEFAINPADGSPQRYIHAISELDYDNNGKPYRIISAFQDITEKKLTEKELENYRLHLEKLVRERTEEYEAANEELKATNEELHNQHNELEIALHNLKETQNKLIQSEKMASLGVLAAGVAHEINNPLNFINGGSLGLENYFKKNLQDKLEDVKPLIDAIQVGVKRAADIVTSLNHYSRRNDLPNSECDVHSIIDHCLVMLNNQIKNKIEITKEYTDNQYSLLSNEGKLHQVFLNILANASQAIENCGKIKIQTQIENNRIIIAISDTGCGISNDIIHKITDPFFTTKDPGKGTGLGLSITYSIISEFDGTLDFESQPGIGTKTIITLPLNIN